MKSKKWDVYLKSKFLRNGMWMYLLQIFNTVIPLITLPYITRILGASKYGVFTIAFNIVGYLQVFVEYGFGMSATRKVALMGENTEKLSKLFSSVILSRILIFFSCIFMSIIYIAINRNNIEICISFSILVSSLVGYSIQQNWIFQGLQDMKYIAVANIASRCMSVCGIFLMVKDMGDLYLYCFLYAMSPILSSILGIVFAIKRYRIKFVKVSVEEILEELKEGFYVFSTQISSKIFGTIGVTFLGIFATNAEVGKFSAIQKIASVIILMWAPISQIIYPKSSQKMNESWEEGVRFVKKIRNIIIPSFLCIIGMICLFSKPIIYIAFGRGYVNKYYWLIPLLLWVLVAINNNFAGIQILLGGGYDKYYSKCFQISVVATMIFNFILIYFFKGDGAAIAPLISEIFLGWLLKNQVKKIEHIHYNKKI